MLKLKHWQVFFILLVGLFMCGLKIEDNYMLTSAILLAGSLIYYMWPLLIGHGLYLILPEKIDINYNLFLINGVICIVAPSVGMIITDGKEMTFHGLAALPFFYLFYALFYFFAFPARVLKSIETGQEVPFKDCIGDFFLILFLPIGIWFLQPRINRVIQEQGRK